MTLHLFQIERPHHSARNAATASATPRSSEHGRWARYLNATLGLWLFVSAFAWQHAPSSRINTCLVGLFVVVSAVTATGWAQARRLTAVLALWLTFTTLAVYPARSPTLWNNLLVALAMLALSLVPDGTSRTRLP
jgi:hypothetical protein